MAYLKEELKPFRDEIEKTYGIKIKDDDELIPYLHQMWTVAKQSEQTLKRSDALIEELKITIADFKKSAIASTKLPPKQMGGVKSPINWTIVVLSVFLFFAGGLSVYVYLENKNQRAWLIKYHDHMKAAGSLPADKASKLFYIENGGPAKN